MDSIPKDFVDFVSTCMDSFRCSSHDYAHCMRVVNLAMSIAIAEGADVKIVAVAALVHDVLDSKLTSDIYASSGDLETLLRTKLLAFQSEDATNIVINIIKDIGYKTLLKPTFDLKSKSIEHKCVQDADLLDAIGTIGVARCFSFGGSRNRELFAVKDLSRSLSAEEYASNQSNRGNTGDSGVQHFFDKLLRLKLYVSTNEGRRIAEIRTNTMISFLDSLSEELIVSGSSDGFILREKLAGLRGNGGQTDGKSEV